MADESVITDEMRQAVGVESEPSVFEIEKAAIRRWAEAIGDPNPLYHDEEHAKKCGYDSIIAPPGFIAQYAFPVKSGRPSIRISGSFSRNLNGGNEYEFFGTIQAGDVITATNKLTDLYEKKGRLGMMLFRISETTFTNQKGEIVAKARGTGISY